MEKIYNFANLKNNVMNKKITSVLFCITAIFASKQVNAQTYQSLNVVNGFNYDLVANGSGAAASSSTESVDGSSATTGFVFMSTDFVNGSGATPASGLPANGQINSATTSGLTFQLSSYSGNNALRLPNLNDSGMLAFGSNLKASKVFVLATSGNGSSKANIVVNFTDGTSQTFNNNTINDWYGGNSFAIKGIGRASRITDNIENNVNDPRLYEIALAIDPANQTKNIANISIAKSQGSGILCVFGVSYLLANSCVAPSNLAVNNVTSNSATATWVAASGASTYELYRSDSNAAPTSATVPTTTGLTGTSANITGLSPATSYYLWVRANCGGGSTSDWNPTSANFTTMCDSVNLPYTENFNSNTTTALPQCMDSQIVNAGATSDWSVGDASGLAGFSSYAVYMVTNGIDADTWLYTKGVNLQGGVTYTLSFDYANYLNPQSFKVAYGTSQVNTAMTNVIQSYPDVNVTNYATGTVDITPSTTGVYYFGFNNYTPGSNGSGYLLMDNIMVTDSVLSTSENLLSKNSVNIYPNPTSDYLNIKTDKKITEMTVYDISGKKVFSSNSSDRKIDVSQLAKGTYILTIKSADGTMSNQKFIKK